MSNELNLEQALVKTAAIVKEYVDEKDKETLDEADRQKLPITLGAFQYNTWGSLSGDTVEEQAQHLAKYDVIVYQGALSDDLSMSSANYQRDLALYKKALEYNPDLKVFGYVTARGFANSKSGGHVGMTEYRTSPDNVDHPIWTKEELCAYIKLMAHCGGTKSDSEVDEFGNPVITGGIPLYGVYYDDYDYNFTDDNTHLINQGDWESIREKHNFLIDYAHSLGLSNMPNSNPYLVFDNEPTPNSVTNPDGIPSHMNENDWFSLESYFLRSDYTFGASDHYASDYNSRYRDTYKSKCLALTYIYAVSDDAEDNQQIASTFAVCQAMCQRVDVIALHGANFVPEIPDEFTKYYDKDNSAVCASGNGYCSMTVNGHSIVVNRSVADTSYGDTPNSASLSTCRVTIDGRTFNNIFVGKNELTYKVATIEKEFDEKIDDLSDTVAKSSNLYHRAFIDDWTEDYTVADYTNHCFTFRNAFGGEDTGTTSNWDSEHPYDFGMRLPANGSWRRVEMDARHLAGMTVELGFETMDVYLEGSPSTKPTLHFYLVGICESGSNLNLTFTLDTKQKSCIDGVNRWCRNFTFPDDLQTLRITIMRTSNTPDGTWIVEAVGSYLVDVNEHPIKKTWFTNYAPPVTSWEIGNHSTLTRSEEDDSVTVNYGQLTNCWELNTKFPANTTIFKPGETWEVGFKDVRLTQPSTGKDVTNKLIILFNLGSKLATVSINNKTHDNLLSMKSEVSDDRFAIARFTVPNDYDGGMNQTPMYIYVSGYIGGDDNGMYQLYVKGLYMYKLDERDELFIRGEDPSDTYIGINRVRTDTIDEELNPNFLHVVDDGTMFITDFKGRRVNINAGVNVTAEVGQTIVVKEVDADGKPAKWEAAEYQEKICGTGIVTLLPETVNEIDPEEGRGMVVADKLELSADDTLIVAYNGVEYTCNGFDSGEGAIYFGNLSAIDPDNFADTGEPFIAGYAGVDFEETGVLTYVWMIGPLDGSTTVTLSIKKQGIIPIPHEYLSENQYIYEIPFESFGYNELSGERSYYFASMHEIPLALLEAMAKNKPVYLKILIKLEDIGVTKVSISPANYSGVLAEAWLMADKSQEICTIDANLTGCGIELNASVAYNVHHSYPFYIRFKEADGY